MISLKVSVRQVRSGNRETNHPPPRIMREGQELTLNPEMSSLEGRKAQKQGDKLMHSECKVIARSAVDAQLMHSHCTVHS